MLTWPMHAFIIFENPDGVNAAMEYLTKEDHKYWHLKHAPMPSDIKWNSRNKQSANQKLKKLATYFMITFILLSLLSVIVWIKYHT
jgi:hypothetical protein